ncbi:GHKL domain-containing protein [Parashewanella curva]|uniref:histidine kinase n=1 Tax=Parashewanella curva TaxID=2338552 RepID=A0A3L8Q1Z6_9GAMM|nr:ATP-binding protein [Parashewanella curva]RLV61686.1 GHKL domain-containing protein [Parashewanella curva]
MNLSSRLALILGSCSAISVLLILWSNSLLQQPNSWLAMVNHWLGWDISWLFHLCVILCGVWLVKHLTANISNSLQALEVGLLNFKDNDFSVTVPEVKDKEVNRLIQLFNQAAMILRKEKQSIYQRELLLDKVIQSSPHIMLLLDNAQRVIYSNDAARHWFAQGKSITGCLLQDLSDNLPPEMAQIIQSQQEGLFTLNQEEAESWHISRGTFVLNGQHHNLLLLKQLTKEISRQEVQVWKKVIRIISHELNNSLAPIASMVNSGRKLTQENQSPKLNLIFDTIESRCSHLNQFIFNYARFAKLPLPQKASVEWEALTQQLSQHYSFKLTGQLPSEAGYFDQIQIEQVLLNLLKNAHESGSKLDEITMTIQTTRIAAKQGVSISISDAGSGMSSEVMQQALLPFYSTKQSGTGLGLPLCREIIEAHDGQISLHHRQSQGLVVQVWLPC